MTTKAKGITLPAWNNLRLTNGYFETSSTTDFSGNSSYKYSGAAVSPINAICLVTGSPQDFTISSQNANAGFAAIGGGLILSPGTGTGGNSSGNLTIKDTAGNGSAWNTSHLVIGNYHFWVDAAARLRIKTIAPTSDTDGNVVGIDLSGSAVYDPPSLADGVGTTTTIAVAGAALGDFALASFSLDLQGITVSAYVSVANTVSVRFQNESGGLLDLASGTLRVRVIKQ